MTIFNIRYPAVSAVAIIVATLAAPNAFAAEPTPAAKEGAGAGSDKADEIIVTARSRNETLQSVPVVVTSVSGTELQRRGITSIDGISRIVPQLITGDSGGSLQGGAIALRGIGSGDNNVFGDQAVAFNIDGVLVARTSVRRLANFDLQQVDVLKGPQALYYGKNSPGGVIIIRTADPTSTFAGNVSVGYEAIAREVRGEAFVSGPLTSTIGARLALYGSTTRGWGTNIAPQSATYGPIDLHTPKTDEFAGRLTLVLADGGPFKARLKVNYSQRNDNGVSANAQRIYCNPTQTAGATLSRGPDDCTADDRVVRSDFGPVLQTVNSLFPADGKPYGKTTSGLVGLDMAYDLGSGLKLQAQSGFFGFGYRFADNSNVNDNTAAPTRLVASVGHVKIDEYSQEIKLVSDFQGQFNFLVGGFIQAQDLSTYSIALTNALAPNDAGGTLPTYSASQKTSAWSVFGNVLFRPVETVELSVGGRYSKEHKHIRFFYLGASGLLNTEIVTAVPERSWSDFSPELVATWRPTSHFTLFGAYKQGFLSGGFNPGNATPAVFALDRSYDAQKVSGFEIGIKSMLFDNRLRLNLAIYDYKIDKLVVTSFVGTTQLINNAATSTSKGFEVEANLRTPYQPLTLHGSLAYNKARYGQYTAAPCYTGQVISQGCSRVDGANQQNLSGTPLLRAPDWSGGMGGTLEFADAARNQYSLSVDGNYTSSFYTDGTNNPTGIQPAYWMLDANASIKTTRGIEFALIGRNLLNTYTFQRSAGVILSGSAATTGTVGPGIVPDQVAVVGRGREVLMRVSLSF